MSITQQHNYISQQGLRCVRPRPKRPRATAVQQLLRDAGRGSHRTSLGDSSAISAGSCGGKGTALCGRISSRAASTEEAVPHQPPDDSRREMRPQAAPREERSLLQG